MPLQDLKCLTAGLFHLHSFLSLCWDERRVKLDSEDDEQLWRLMFRRGGMQRLEFKHAQKLGRQVNQHQLPSLCLDCQRMRRLVSSSIF